MLLLGLSNILDLAEEIRDPFGIMAKSYENMYGRVPKGYKRHNFNHLVWRSLKTGYIEKVVKDGIPYLRLTSRGKSRIERDFPLLAVQRGKWDRKWRIVIFDIEEINKQTREKFRHKLKELGFGMLQESVFISPYDIAKDFAEFIEAQGLSDSAYVLEVSTIVVGDMKSFANRIWKLEELDKEYNKIIQKIKENDLTTTSDRIKQLNDNGNNVKTKDLINKILKGYMELVLKDPFLPEELLPVDWGGKKARILIKKLQRLIKE